MGDTHHGNGDSLAKKVCLGGIFFYKPGGVGLFTRNTKKNVFFFSTGKDIPPGVFFYGEDQSGLSYMGKINSLTPQVEIVLYQRRY